MNTKATNTPTEKYVYWVGRETLEQARVALRANGIKLVSSLLTPCQTLRTRAHKAVYASPSVWSRVCVRQGSWYRNSRHNGEYLLVSEQPLPPQFDAYLDCRISETDFVPARLPGEEELQALADSTPYQQGKPEAWEGAGIKDAVMFKMLFTLTRFWGRGDNLRKYWLSHRAVHANFLTRKFTTEMDGEAVPYSVADNAGICSSCVEMFNLVDDRSRKLVRACPGAVTFGGARRNVYVDIQPRQRAAAA